MKIVINACFGGFGLSHDAVLRYLELSGKKVWVEEDEKSLWARYTYWLVPPEERVEGQRSEQTFYDNDVVRDDPQLTRTVEELGQKAGGQFSSLSVVEVPDGVEWQIEEYDGYEHVAEKHRTWR